jgi:cytochrome oxidase Cu insertion factor (SCO1/SenC/PrrC family)
MKTNQPKFYFILSLLLVAGFLVTTGLSHAGPKEPMPLKGSFSLIDEEGKKVTLEGYRGQYLLIYFGYTYCPDVCPTSLGIISEVLAQISITALDKLLPIFVTLDPERDDITHMKDYTEVFHPKLMGLTGTLKETTRAAKTFGVYFAKAEIDPEDPTDYLVDHSSNTFLLDPQGRILEVYGHAPEVSLVVKGIESHLNK